MPRPAKGRGICTSQPEYPSKGHMDIIEFRNVGDKPVPLKHAGMGKVILQPGKSAILPIEYATLNVGHPNARNEGKNLWRDQAYKHIRTRWGFYPGLMTEEEWDEMKPTIELYTLDGERLYSVIDDPEGVMGNPETVEGQPAGDAFLQSQVAAMQKQIERLTALIAAQQGVDTPVPAIGKPELQVPSEGFTPEQLAAAMSQTTFDNAVENTIPEPPKNEKVGKDGPRTTRVGGKG